jgi:hypothetical protein
MKERVISIREQSLTQQQYRWRDELMLVVIQLSRHGAREQPEQNREQASATDYRVENSFPIKAAISFRPDLKRHCQD